MWAFTELAYLYYFYRNEAPHKINQLHQKYGRVIRIGPKTFSTIDPESWNIIYGQQTTKRFPKANYALMDPKSTATNLVNATEVDHVRQRKLINHAFSEKALKDQEEIIMTYIQTLISKFQEISTETKDGGEVSISKWMVSKAQLITSKHHLYNTNSTWASTWASYLGTNAKPLSRNS